MKQIKLQIKLLQYSTINCYNYSIRSESDEDNENSCARVDAILIRRKDSKSHVKGNT